MTKTYTTTSGSQNLRDYETDVESDEYLSGYDSSRSADVETSASSRRGTSPVNSEAISSRPNTSTPSEMAGTDLMDDGDSLNDDGSIIWRHLSNANSMKSLAKHLGMPDSDGYRLLKTLMETTPIKGPLQQLLANTADNKNHCKPKTMMKSILEDRGGAKKYSGSSTLATDFTAYDWTCHTLERVKVALCTEISGPSYQKSREEEYLYTRAWSLIRFMRWNSSKSRTRKRTRRSSPDPSGLPAKRQKTDQTQGLSRIEDSNQGIVQDIASTANTGTLILAVNQEVTNLGGDIGEKLLSMVRERHNDARNEEDAQRETKFIEHLVTSLRNGV